MELKVLGTGCAKCKLLFAEAEKAVTAAGLPASLGKVEKIGEIMKFGVMMTPALVIDGEVKCAGRIPKAAPAQQVAANPPAASFKSQAASKLARLVFIDKEKACDCSRKRVEETWNALQSALGTPPALPVQRLHVDTQAAEASA